MKQEQRYIVIKNTDLDEAITPKEQIALFRICTKILVHRRSIGKDPLRCVVVESGWPEFDATWQAIAARVDGVPENALPA